MRITKGQRMSFNRQWRNTGKDLDIILKGYWQTKFTAVVQTGRTARNTESEYPVPNWENREKIKQKSFGRNYVK